MSGPTVPKNQKIAVIGAGAAGLSAAYLLSKLHQVTLFESASTLGGHAHANNWTDSKGTSFDVDTAFLIFNERTYTQFLKFMNELGVGHHAMSAEMSSCFSDHKNKVHYAVGGGWSPMFAKPLNYLNKDLLFILRDLKSFRKRASQDLALGTDLSGISAEQYLSCYSRVFVENFVLPLTSAIWSLPTAKMNNYPIASLLDYFNNHQLLGGPRGYHWRTFKGSSQVYINAFEKKFTGAIRKNSSIQKISRDLNSVRVKTNRYEENFDQVVVATHADSALKLIENPTTLESQLLGTWKYQNNPVTLHQDTTKLYADKRFWCSWNMIRNSEDYQISYYLNRLQKLPTTDPMILTLGASNVKSEKSISFNYRHPIFDTTSVATQAKLGDLNGKNRLFFCGSYFGHGFHEDAVRSATDIAKHFGIDWGTVL